MTRTIAACAVVWIVGAGCGREETTSAHTHATTAGETATDVTPQTFALGARLAPNGGVPDDATTENFTRGAAIFLSVDLSGATTAETIEVTWRDGRGRVVRRETKAAAKGVPYAAFSSGATSSWSAGRGHVVIIIHGRQVAEREFVLT